MLVHLSSFPASERTLTPEKSRALLDFCRSCGVDTFTVNFVYVEGEDSQKQMTAFYERLTPFQSAPRVLECIESSGFTLQSCWLLDDSSTETILRETNGDLLAYNVLCQPEDWLFYRGDIIFLQIVSHEQEATLRLSAAEYERFQLLGIPHGLGRPQFTGLTEEPVRPKVS